MICGIDEAGRGCCAGDLVVAGSVFLETTDIQELLDDSKKLSEKKREILYEKIVTQTVYHIVTISPQEIDNLGISASMQRALHEIRSHINAHRYIFDGNTNFGVSGIETQIKADATIPQVSAASILAKVTHDRNIRRSAEKFPQYHFEKHKGYATALHVDMIKKYGYCDIHRKSYRLKALEKTLFDM